jgi:hypothetical protein
VSRLQQGIEVAERPVAFELPPCNAWFRRVCWVARPPTTGKVLAATCLLVCWVVDQFALLRRWSRLEVTGYHLSRAR